MSTRCDSIRFTWNPPTRGQWASAPNGYAVYHERADRIAYDMLPQSYDELVSSGLPHRVTTGAATSLEVGGLDASTDYVVTILPRNSFGWGLKWSPPVVVGTRRGKDAPPALEAPAVHPHDDTCSSIDVRVGPFGQGCRRPDEVLVQVYAEATRGWTTVSRMTDPVGGSASVRAIDAERAFLVRLVARNERGTGPPSEATTLNPGQQVGCESERDWEPPEETTELAASEAASKAVSDGAATPEEGDAAGHTLTHVEVGGEVSGGEHTGHVSARDTPAAKLSSETLALWSKGSLLIGAAATIVLAALGLMFARLRPPAGQPARIAGEEQLAEEGRLFGADEWKDAPESSHGHGNEGGRAVPRDDGSAPLARFRASLADEAGDASKPVKTNLLLAAEDEAALMARVAALLDGDPPAASPAADAAPAQEQSASHPADPTTPRERPPDPMLINLW